MKKRARDARPKGRLETVAEVRRLLDLCGDEEDHQGRRQGVQRKAQASIQGEVRHCSSSKDSTLTRCRNDGVEYKQQAV